MYIFSFQLKIKPKWRVRVLVNYALNNNYNPTKGFCVVIVINPNRSTQEKKFWNALANRIVGGTISRPDITPLTYRGTLLPNIGSGKAQSSYLNSCSEPECPKFMLIVLHHRHTYIFIKCHRY